MKTKIMALTLFTCTTAAITLYPYYQSFGAINPFQTVTPIQPMTNQVTNGRHQIEVVFALDTTGSMGGLIEAAKEKIWSIASNMGSAQSAPEIKMGLVAYRDRGDAYVTKVFDLSSDLDSMYANLMDFRAAGGGDGPESVNQALYDAVNRIGWSQDSNTYRVVFLVGDAPPHMDYQDDVKYPETIALAKSRGIVINTIQAGNNKKTGKRWNQIAQIGGGQFFEVGQNGSAVAIATPFDKKLAKLSRELDDTRLYYGTKKERAKQQKKVEASDKLHASASIESRARRATFNSSKSGKTNFLGKQELIDDIASGRVDLDKIEAEKLPDAIQAMAPVEQKAEIKKKAQKRDELQRQIGALAKQRSSYLSDQVEKNGGAKDSLDRKIFEAVKEQAKGAGLSYESEDISY